MFEKIESIYNINTNFISYILEMIDFRVIILCALQGKPFF